MGRPNGRRQKIPDGPGRDRLAITGQDPLGGLSSAALSHVMTSGIRDRHERLTPIPAGAATRPGSDPLPAGKWETLLTYCPRASPSVHRPYSPVLAGSWPAAEEMDMRPTASRRSPRGKGAGS